MLFLNRKKVFTTSIMIILGQWAFSSQAMDTELNSDVDGIKGFFQTVTNPKKTVKMRYYYEDPTVMTTPGELTTTVSASVLGRPKLEDKDIVITSSPKPDKNGQFIFKPQTADFDKASVFATVRIAMNMYRGDLEAIRSLYPSDSQIRKVVKYWDAASYGQLRVTAEAGNDANAYYNRMGTLRELKFFTFVGNNRKTIHTCRSSDIVAHEAGHAMLDIIHPEYFDANSLQTGGYHESFGDQTAIFWTLSHKFLCDKLIADTKGNLHQHKKNFLAALAEQFGQGLDLPNGLRNADEDIKLKDAEEEVHAISSVYTGVIYDVLASAFEEATLKISDPGVQAVKLYDVAKQFRQVNLESMVALVNPEPSYSDFAFALDTAFKRRAQSGNPSPLDSLSWSKYINSEFTRRGISVASNAGGKGDIKVKKVHLCGTVPHHHLSHEDSKEESEK